MTGISMMLLASSAGPTGSLPASVAVTTRCEAMVPSYCQGAYGLLVHSDGSWRAGPAPDGTVRTGRVPAGKVADLFALAEQALAAPPPPECRGVGPIPGVHEELTVRQGERMLVLHGAAGTIDASCAIGAPVLEKLFAVADALMRRLYPQPF
jgi:hypothetical protein